MNGPEREFDFEASRDFSRARAASFVNRLVELLSGQSRQLLVFDEVREKLHLGGPVYRGVQSVALEKIVGSVDRYRDFDRLFMPTQSHTRSRWHRISKAWYRDISLPPVLLYKVGDVYFVVDGNHRVSVARSKNQVYIDAEVRECESRVPLTGELEAGDLERLGARVEFLERTRIDQLLPDAELAPTLLGGYDRLIEHIAVHRYFMGVEAAHEIAEDDAVRHWYVQVYQPVEEVVLASDVLADLPGRTAADIYLWVMDHLYYLHQHRGRGEIQPADAAEDFLSRLDEMETDE